MNLASASMSVMVTDEFACIRIIGRANFTSSIDFKALVTELSQRGFQRFVLDLSECVLMDSTFLGVLAGFGLKLDGGNSDQAPRGVELFNPNARIIELLETLGVLQLFKLTPATFTLPPEAGSIEHSPSTPGKAELTQTCLDAHQTLMDINPANVVRFKDVTRFLAENLKKLKPV
ncbi:MAG: STAS domain-containing protein [Verrucomicrobiota bacterium]|jgi:anti-sigma B factor antagonist